MFLHNLLNVLVQIVDKMGLPKKNVSNCSSVCLQEGVSVADVAVWSVLFLLATGAKHQQELLSEQGHVQRWFSHLSIQPEVQVW
jgi:glutathione S-transferase